jgi:hypothetical protein
MKKKALYLSNKIEATSKLESVDNYPIADTSTSISLAV